MTVIWKFKLEQQCTLTMPIGAKILHTAMQFDIPTIWVEVDELAEREHRQFFVFGTGHQIVPHDGFTLSYVGTAVGPTFVWHVYEAIYNGQEPNG